MKRSVKWAKVRKEHLKLFPSCAVCGAKKFLEVHHILPFHLFPEKELVESNLITLCEQKGHECHLQFGHLGSYQSYNKDVVEDAKHWLKKRSERP